MATPADYSERNVAETVGAYLADTLLGAGFAVYWWHLDALELPSGWYGNYAASYTAYAADPTYAAELAAVKAVVTLRDELPANPTFLARPTSEGPVVGDADEVAVPVLALVVEPAQALRYVEMGTDVRRWSRYIELLGFCRSREERRILTDLLTIAFRPHTTLTVHAHDVGTNAVVGPMEVVQPGVDADLEWEGPVATSYILTVRARVEYEA